MASLAAALPVIIAAFVASAVEVVEAFTIVLAVSVIRGPRPAIIGTALALALLAAAVAIFGPMLAAVPVHGLQLAIGILLLIFGLGWLKKAILRAGGALALHDEAAAFEKHSQDLRARAGEAAADWNAGLTAFQAVLLEGTEVVFIVLAVGARPGLLLPAVTGAAVAVIVVLGLGLLVRQPLAKVPENSLKFAVGALISSFGVFWTAEGLGAPFPLGDWAIGLLIAGFLAFGLVLAAAVRRGAGGSPAWT